MVPRKRTALVFVALTLIVYGLLIAQPFLIMDLGGAHLYALLAAAAFGIAALIAQAWLVRRVYGPMDALARDAHTLVTAHNVDRPLRLPAHENHLGPLPKAVNEVVEALRVARSEAAQALQDATARMAEQKSWLEVILLDLSEGVVVCNESHRILLYNQSAMRMLRSPEATGLGRSLFGLVTREPVLHTLELLQHRRKESPNPGEGADFSAPFVCSTSDARVMLQGRMALICDHDGKTTGYVVTLTDISNDIAAIVKSDAVRRAVTRDLRGPVAALRAAAETMGAYPDMPAQQRLAFDQVVLKESAEMSDRIETLAAQFRGHSGMRWPMADIHSLDLFKCAAQHLKDAEDIDVTIIGIPLWLHGDGHSLMLALEKLMAAAARHVGVQALDLEALLGDKRVYVDVVWQGAPIPTAELETWLEQPVDGSVGRQTLREIMERHGSDPWSAPERQGRSLLRVPLLAPLRTQFVEDTGARPPPRPEFYDFGLMREHSVTGGLGKRRLDELPCVVFDTETTGLKPTEGDEILQIGAVRVVNRRVLTGETFERLVHPGKTIPKDSIQYHGITDDMVRDKPPISVVLPQFHSFAGEGVLVAHNAAFDMRFVKKREKESGVEFHNPVLDTMLISMFLDPDSDDHSLDGVAKRLGITVTGRHSALGDAMATAEILVHLFDRLIAKGHTTFDSVMRASNMTAELRIRELHW